MIQLQADPVLPQELCLREGKKKISNTGPLHPLFIKKKKKKTFPTAMKSAFISIPFFDNSQKKAVGKKVVHDMNSVFTDFHVHTLLQWTYITWS